MSYKKSARFALLGCFFMLASTFFYWRNIYFRISEKTYTGISFISIARKCFQMGISARTIVLPILLLLFYAVVVFLIIAAIKDNISKKPFFPKYKKRIRIVMILATLILVIVMTKAPVFKESLEQLEAIHLSWKVFIDQSKNTYMENVGEMFSYYTVGPGFIAYVIGTIFYIFSIGYSFVLDTINEDDDEEMEEE